MAASMFAGRSLGATRRALAPAGFVPAASPHPGAADTGRSFPPTADRLLSPGNERGPSAVGSFAGDGQHGSAGSCWPSSPLVSRPVVAAAVAGCHGRGAAHSSGCPELRTSARPRSAVYVRPLLVRSSGHPDLVLVRPRRPGRLSALRSGRRRRGKHGPEQPRVPQFPGLPQRRNARRPTACPL